MKRLNNQTPNTPEMADGIFERRWKGDVHYIDWARFKLLADKFKGGKYLDVGCFNSPMPGYLADEIKDSEIHALDHAPKVIETMQSKFPKVHYKLHNFLGGLPYEDNSFDYVVVGEVIEHLEDPAALIYECRRVLKPGGIFALSTPFEETISQPAVSNEHVWAFTENDISELLANFKNVEISLYRDSVKTFIAYGTKN